MLQEYKGKMKERRHLREPGKNKATTEITSQQSYEESRW